MSELAFDRDRFEEEWAADQDVLQNLAANGDHPERERQIDVSFRGEIDALEALENGAADFGFAVLEWAVEEENGPWLYLERTQAADPDSIRSLTIACLQIEHLYGVEYDGWGCMAQDGLNH